MMQVIDQDYLREMVALPDGFARLERWVHGLIEDRDTSEQIAKCVVAQVAPLKRRVVSLLEANNRLVFDKRDVRVELEAQLDAAHAELDGYRAGPIVSDAVLDPAFLEVAGTAEEAQQLIEWFTKRTDLDLSYQYDLEVRQIPQHLLTPGPIPEEGWTVHQRSGSVNDREWHMISLESTAIAALREAHKAFCDGR